LLQTGRNADSVLSRAGVSILADPLIFVSSINADESANVVAGFRGVASLEERAFWLRSGWSTADLQIDASLERRVGRVSIALTEPNPLNSIVAIGHMVWDLEATAASVRPTLITSAISTVPVIGRATTISCGTPDLIALIIEHGFRSIESILRA